MSTEEEVDLTSTSELSGTAFVKGIQDFLEQYSSQEVSTEDALGEEEPKEEYLLDPEVSQGDPDFLEMGMHVGEMRLRSERSIRRLKNLRQA